MRLSRQRAGWREQYGIAVGLGARSLRGADCPRRTSDILDNDIGTEIL